MTHKMQYQLEVNSYEKVGLQELVDWLLAHGLYERFIQEAKQNIYFAAVDFSCFIVHVKAILKK